MSDIFISYASADRQQAETLAQGLKAQGWTVWWDRTIPTGRTFDEVIEEALDAAKVVIVLWSEKSVKSSWVRAEAQEGANRKILIPILIEKVRIPLAFRRIQSADLIGWDGSYTASSFQGLVGDIAALLGPPPKEEEKRKQAEAEAKRKAEEKRQQAETEARRKAEEKRQQAEAEAKRKAEVKRQEAEAEARRKAEEKRQQAEAEARRKAEEKRQQAEAEAKRKAEEKRQQAEAEARRKAEEKRQQAEAEAKRKDVGASEQIEVIPTSEPIPDELDHPKPTGLETEKAESKVIGEGEARQLEQTREERGPHKRKKEAELKAQSQGIILWTKRRWYLIFGLVLIVLTAILVLAIPRIRNQGKTSVAMSNAKNLALAMQFYADDYDGRFPPADSWPVALEPYFDSDQAIFTTPFAPDAGRAWAMNPNLQTRNIPKPSKTVLIFEARFGSPPAGGPELLPEEPRSRRGYVIAFADGHAECFPPERLDELIWHP